MTATKDRKDHTEQELPSEMTHLDIDHILVEELGQFGKYQLRTFLLCVVLIIFVAFSSSEYVFTTARISTRCHIPECDSESPQFAPSWILNAVPSTSANFFDNCQRFGNTTSVTAVDQTCPANLFDQQTMVSCQEYVYEDTNSVVYDYGLACKEWRRSLIGMFRTFGNLVALPITGFISDHWGRRMALSIGAVNTCWLGVVRYWADTYWGFTISVFVEAASGSGYSCAYILLMELVGPKFRVATGAAVNTCFSIGEVLLGLIAWGVPNWRDLTLVLYVPMIVTISYFWIISESIRWLLSKGRIEESEKILKNVAQINGKQLSEKSLLFLRETTEEIIKRKEEDKIDCSRTPWLPILVFRYKPILIRCCISPIWWITMVVVYYGLSINSVNMSGNRYVNYIVVSSVEIPGYWTAFFLMSRIGRKPVLIGAFWACAACMIGYIFLPSGMYGLSLTLYLFGKYSIAMVVTSVYVYTAELYPTKHRHSLLAFSSMCGRIGSIIAPLTPALGETFWVNLPFALFAGLSLLSGCLIFITPETLGTRLPDTMEEAAVLEKIETSR